jgi:hypothetical protein
VPIYPKQPPQSRQKHDNFAAAPAPADRQAAAPNPVHSDRTDARWKRRRRISAEGHLKCFGRLQSERAGDDWRTHVVSDRNAYIVTPRNEINVAETYEYIEAITQLCAATNKIFRKPKIRALTRMGDIKSP